VRRRRGLELIPEWRDEDDHHADVEEGESLDVLEGLARDGMTMVVVSHELSLADHVAARS
jgi:ABC-type histidine transport system ATPase subunit